LAVVQALSPKAKARPVTAKATGRARKRVMRFIRLEIKEIILLAEVLT
jgi:hypothetical protein